MEAKNQKMKQPGLPFGPKYAITIPKIPPYRILKRGEVLPPQDTIPVPQPGHCMSRDKSDHVHKWLDTVVASDISLGRYELSFRTRVGSVAEEVVPPSFVTDKGPGLREEYIQPVCDCGKMITETHRKETCTEPVYW
ncbi:hypothetical protein PVAG01_10041 [Phlyctema vagabunda]|uniref:Uncharacterized protein n=1 Tax=Phlyctema vagabunda TaxID=108571 RepID=A0ABR4P4S9_9HELO